MEPKKLIEKYKTKIDELEKDLEKSLVENNNSKRSNNLIIPFNWRFYYEQRLNFLSNFVSFSMKLIALVCFFYLLIVFFLDVHHIYEVYIEKHKISTKLRLEFIEHLFIIFIPFLVALGLYYYFEKTFAWQIFKKGDEPPENLLKLAKENLNLTKTLFISSIMSYTILKIIEVLFYSNENEELNPIKYIKEISYLDLIPHFIFLIILMLYLIKLHSHPVQKKPIT